jgi:hypothetical protein
MNRIAAAAIAMSLAACTSPEAERTRGGGPGGDTGNRGEVVRMHEGAHPYANTPRLIPTEPPPLDTARQAHVLSEK